MMNNTWKSVLCPIACGVGMLLSASPYSASGKDIEFNTDFLDVKNRDNVNIAQFSRKGFILPGVYLLQIKINGQTLPQEFPVNWVIPEHDPQGSEVCAEPELVTQLGIKPELAEKLVWITHGERQCLAPDSLKGMDFQADLGHSTLLVNLPQAYMEYSDVDWDPPARWDNGIPGIILDYNINNQLRHDQESGSEEQSISGNGTLGANLGAWRLRADWQASYDHRDDDENTSTLHDQSWSRYYAYRALPTLGAKLTLGESYLQSDVFDSFNYIGASVVSDDQMLPPKLRGYAPEIVGIARSNAKVKVSWQGRVLYETQVPAGPFRIQDLNQSVSGTLHVTVEEQNGQTQEFDVNTASVPFLTRPGMVRYKMALGRPQDWDHHPITGTFASAEASWGVTNGWSLYGGAIGESNYQAVALGSGKDLGVVGAVAVDITHSIAHMPQDDGFDGETLQGNSYRISYSRDFDEIDSRLTFAGYRFSEKNFMSMSDYLDAKTYHHLNAGHEKERYTVTYNQNFREQGMSAYFSYSRSTFWDSPDQSNYNLSLSWYFDLGSIKNLSASLNGYRSEYNGDKDDGVYISLSVPWGNDSISYNGTFNGSQHRNQLGYSGHSQNGDNWQLHVGQDEQGAQADGYYSHQGALTDIDLSADYEEGSYRSLGMSLRGGMTLTTQGGALHRGSLAGSTRLLVDTDGIADVPVSGSGSPTSTNVFGKAVIADVGSYSRSLARIDLNKLPEKAEATKSVVQITLTEGAIGYRHFDVVSGEKMMAVFRLADGDFPPFGAEVKNERQQQLGLVADDGNAWLAGVKAGETLKVFWDGAAQCEASLPPTFTPELLANALLLPCKMLEGQPPTTPQKSSPLPAQPLIQEHTQTDGQPAAPVATTTQTPPIPLADNHAVNRKDME
ncbi:fimbrial biogenesis outer membrane usher protein [Salmonella enterica subsp. enterica serovar Corvallis]|nr:fimbrial biogenesis outer membrane usher protein [Salmonella enterica]EHS5456068.1 fimbrial biogenesis outer membrane usher protein [Salmonella enterica subsp. enterica serovar Corvallis]